jgi:predicted Rossmann fold nucleotide-binding protein DprA/Smf involved in DNA uptake
MKVAVVGSRTFNDYALMCQELGKIPQKGLVLVSGGAAGADQLAEQYAKEHKLKTIIHKPDWATYGKAAGMIRNTTIVADSDLVVAFWDGISKGTLNTIKTAQKAGKAVAIIKFTPPLPTPGSVATPFMV